MTRPSAVTWSKQYRSAASQEGWYLFFFSNHGTGHSQVQIHAKKGFMPSRYGARRSQAKFATNDEARRFVYTRAADGSAMHRRALMIIAYLTIIGS